MEILNLKGVSFNLKKPLNFYLYIRNDVGVFSSVKNVKFVLKKK